MKVTSEKETPDFVPTKITFEFHTQKELDVFAALFNSSAVIGAVEDAMGCTIERLYEEFEKVGANIDLHVAKLNAEIKSRL